MNRWFNGHTKDHGDSGVAGSKEVEIVHKKFKGENKILKLSNFNANTGTNVLIGKRNYIYRYALKMLEEE
jgi:hypothetical protein